MSSPARRAQALGLLAVTVFAVTAGSPAPAFARAAADDICVALVVDATALGSDVDTDCTTVPDGSTGVDVLDAAGHELTVCRDGIIGEIDGRPANGCTTKDSTHYWSYWHRAPGAQSWTYATEGPATYEPRNESSDGWVWQDGGEDNQPPPATSYRRICPPSRQSASPSPSPSKPAPVGTRDTPSTRPTGPATARAATTEPTATATTHPRRSHRPPTASATPTSPSATPSTNPTAVVASLPDDDSDGGTPVGLIVGAAAIVALAGAAWWQSRRQRSGP